MLQTFTVNRSCIELFVSKFLTQSGGVSHLLNVRHSCNSCAINKKWFDNGATFDVLVLRDGSVKEGSTDQTFLYPNHILFGASKLEAS